MHWSQWPSKWEWVALRVTAHEWKKIDPSDYYNYGAKHWLKYLAREILAYQHLGVTNNLYLHPYQLKKARGLWSVTKADVREVVGQLWCNVRKFCYFIFSFLDIFPSFCHARLFMTPMSHSMAASSILCCLLEFAQNSHSLHRWRYLTVSSSAVSWSLSKIHVHCVDDPF